MVAHLKALNVSFERHLVANSCILLSTSSPCSNAGSMPFRPHKFQEKKAYGNRPRCGPCDNKIKIAKPYYACQDCNLACHKECRQDVVVSCLRGNMISYDFWLRA